MTDHEVIEEGWQENRWVIRCCCGERQSSGLGHDAAHEKQSEHLRRAEFEATYAKHSDMTVGNLRALGLHAEPCDCDDDDCGGWKMASPPPALEIKDGDGHSIIKVWCDGRVDIADGVTLDEASVMFWEKMAQQLQSMVDVQQTIKRFAAMFGPIVGA